MSTIDSDAFARRFAAIKERSALECGASPFHELAVAGRLEAFLARRSPVDWLRAAWLWRGGRARPKQLAPAGDWLTWLYCAGRGSGKTRAGSEWVVEREEQGARSIAIVGPTFRDVVRVQIGGDSGILAVAPPWNRPDWLEVKQELRWPSGAIGYVCTAEKPELRGGNFDSAWCDEPCFWPYLETLWTNLLLALRRRVVGMRPQVVATTTPKPLPWLKSLIMSPTTHTTHGSSTENTANPTSWHREMAHMLGGTRQGAQELDAEVLGDNPGALFAQATINVHRVGDAPSLERIVVAIDPAVSTHRKSDATGIVVVGIAKNGDVYVLADATAHLSPEQWGDKALALFDAWDADAFVVERNRAGDLPKANLRAAAHKRRQSDPAVEEVLALGDKATRAQPVSTLYERGRVHHVGALPRLEAEMTEWDHTTGVSPNGLDALVHAVRHLTKIGEEREPPRTDSRKQVSSWISRHRNVQPSPRDTL